jgi:Rha family phage regulatory protein
VNLKEGKAVTTSLMVAQTFRKRHTHVLDVIKALDCPEGFTEPNFRLSEYRDPTGRRLPMYEITRDAFTLLVMGFTGKKALKFKLAYIKEFNRMEAFIKEQQQPKLPAPEYRTSTIQLPNSNHHSWKECNTG